MRSRIGFVAFALALSALAPTQGNEDWLRARLQAPSNPLQYYDKNGEGIRLYFAGKYEESAQALGNALEGYPLDGLTWLYLAMDLQELKRHKEAIAALQKAGDLRTEVAYWFIDYALAQSYVALGDKQNAYKHLEKLIFEDQSTLRGRLYDDSAFAALKTEPRFLKLAGRIDTSKMSRTEGWRTDIDYLYNEVKRVNHKYSKEPFPAALEERYKVLKRDVPKLSDDQIYTGMAEMLAPLHQGHVTVELQTDTKLSPVRSLPLQFYVFPEGVFIVGADEKHSDLVGSEVLKIEKTPVGDVLRQVELHSSVENPMRILWGGPQFMATMQMLRGLGVVEAGKDEASLTLRGKDGVTKQVKVASETGNQNRKLVPPPVVAPPLFLRDVPNKHWFEAIPNADAAFVQVNQMSNSPKESLEAFGLKLRTFLAETPKKNIVVDLRHNNGGSTSLYPELARTLIAHSVKDGNRLYVIIGRGLYSATSNFITDLKRFAKPIFVGEPSSGIGNQDGDESWVILPYSGVQAWVTSVRWQLSSPGDLRTSQIPDIPVQLTAAAYFAGKDPVLETILEDMKRPARPPIPDFP